MFLSERLMPGSRHLHRIPLVVLAMCSVSNSGSGSTGIIFTYCNQNHPSVSCSNATVVSTRRFYVRLADVSFVSAETNKRFTVTSC